MSSLSENNNVFSTFPLKALSTESLMSNNNRPIMEISESQVNKIWNKSNFSNRQNQKVDLSLNLDAAKMSWSCGEKNKEEEESNDVNEPMEEEKMEVPSKTPTTPEPDAPASPAHHARRPMNAFLIFCKKHRPIVRKKFPNLENRGVTRILGEWWALLDPGDKDAYTNLAKEYKDAFFSANPNFKWYKLPAPPLRTLPARPTSVKHEVSPPLSPSSAVTSPTAEFTPGKLADESQLGMLSSLFKLSNNFSTKPNETFTKQNFAYTEDLETTLCNNNDQTENNNRKDYSLESPLTFNQNNVLPLKPLKKRYSETCADNKNISRNLFECNTDISEQNVTEEDDVNMTNQHLVNKVIDCQFSEEMDYKNGFKDTRKSGRKGKGNRYAEFMANGKLLKNKRDKRDSITLETPKLDLNSTIKRLEERIQPKLIEEPVKEERTRTLSEMSDMDDYAKTMPSFNLDQRITELPTLSYDVYVQRKKESKKRKFVRHKTESKLKLELVTQKSKHPTGSKKRKNKHNITHLEKADSFVVNNFDNNDLSGLATLAEIAAIKEKIDST